MTTKVLNRRQARWAELLASYDFVLVHIRGIHNPADGPSRRPDYAQNVPIPSGSLIPPNALRLLPHRHPSPIHVSNVLFVNLVGVHTGLAPEPDLRERILRLLPADTGVQRYCENPTFPWSMQDGLLLHHGLLYIPEPLRLDVIHEHHDRPLSGHPGVLCTCELITRNYYFPRIQRLVKQYVDSCHLCQTAKPSRHARH
jgi:Integrase zinc binding domain